MTIRSKPANQCRGHYTIRLDGHWLFVTAGGNARQRRLRVRQWKALGYSVERYK
jgi:hypothetical protein